MSRLSSAGASTVSALTHLPRRSIFVSTRRKTADEPQVFSPMPKGIEPSPSVPQQRRRKGCERGAVGDPRGASGARKYIIANGLP